MNRRIKKKLNNRQNCRTYKQYKLIRKYKESVWKDLDFTLEDIKISKKTLKEVAKRYNLQEKWNLIIDNILASLE